MLTVDFSDMKINYFLKKWLHAHVTPAFHLVITRGVLTAHHAWKIQKWVRQADFRQERSATNVN